MNEWMNELPVLWASEKTNLHTCEYLWVHLVGICSGYRRRWFLGFSFCIPRSALVEMPDTGCNCVYCRARVGQRLGSWHTNWRKQRWDREAEEDKDGMTRSGDDIECCSTTIGHDKQIKELWQYNQRKLTKQSDARGTWWPLWHFNLDFVSLAPFDPFFDFDHGVGYSQDRSADVSLPAMYLGVLTTLKAILYLHVGSLGTLYAILNCDFCVL